MKMEINIRVVSKMAKEMDLEYIIIKMEINI
jgi:hypothetical protein